MPPSSPKFALHENSVDGYVASKRISDFRKTTLFSIDEDNYLTDRMPLQAQTIDRVERRRALRYDVINDRHTRVVR